MDADDDVPLVSNVSLEFAQDDDKLLDVTQGPASTTDSASNVPSQPPPPYSFSNNNVTFVSLTPMPAANVYTQQPLPGAMLVASQPIGPPPPSYLGYAIFVTLFCCWPLGIVAIQDVVICWEPRRSHRKPRVCPTLLWALAWHYWCARWFLLRCG